MIFVGFWSFSCWNFIRRYDFQKDNIRNVKCEIKKSLFFSFTFFIYIYKKCFFGKAFACQINFYILDIIIKKKTLLADSLAKKYLYYENKQIIKKSI
jgi:hypothetical protein